MPEMDIEDAQAHKPDFRSRRLPCRPRLDLFVQNTPSPWKAEIGAVTAPGRARPEPAAAPNRQQRGAVAAPGGARPVGTARLRRRGGRGSRRRAGIGLSAAGAAGITFFAPS